MLTGVTWTIATLALVVGAMAFVLSLARLRRHREVSARLSLLFMPERRRGTPMGFVLRELERVGRRVEGAAVNRELQALVLRAGFFQPAALYIFVALRCFIALFVCTTIVVARSNAGGPGPTDLLLGFFFGYLFYRYALIVLKIYADLRAARVRRELPPVLDIMLMTLDAGVSIDQCMRYVADAVSRTAPVTGEVLRRHVADIDAGMPYDAALDRLGQRLGLEEGQDFAATVKQAMFRGGELGTTLRRFSIDLSEKRMATAREQVGRKAPQLTLVMIVFFMPVLLIVLAGPAVVDLTGALKTAGEQLAKREAVR
ncbi:MAG: type II secretion system F family protein [Parvibaculum sp.]